MIITGLFRALCLIDIAGRYGCQQARKEFIITGDLQAFIYLRSFNDKVQKHRDDIARSRSHSRLSSPMASLIARNFYFP